MWTFSSRLPAAGVAFRGRGWFLRLAKVHGQENRGSHGIDAFYRSGFWTQGQPDRKPFGGLASVGDLGDNPPTTENGAMKMTYRTADLPAGGQARGSDMGRERRLR